MAESGREVVDRLGNAMEVGDLDALIAMYSSRAIIVSYSRVSEGHAEIRDLCRVTLATHGHYEVMSVDQFREVRDLVMWDATVQTEAGLLQTTHVILLDAAGLIHHHVPGIRGYWGM